MLNMAIYNLVSIPNWAERIDDPCTWRHPPSRRERQIDLDAMAMKSMIRANTSVDRTDTVQLSSKSVKE